MSTRPRRLKLLPHPVVNGCRSSSVTLLLLKEHVSAQGLVILETLSQQPLNRLPVRSVVECLRPAHGSLASTKASVSRTLRRLHRAGLVELEDVRRRTLTERHAVLDAELGNLEANFESKYAEILAGIIARRVPACFGRGSADGYLEYERRRITREKRSCQSSVAVLTPLGCDVLTIDVETVNVSPRNVNRRTWLPGQWGRTTRLIV